MPKRKKGGRASDNTGASHKRGKTTRGSAASSSSSSSSSPSSSGHSHNSVSSSASISRYATLSANLHHTAFTEAVAVTGDEASWLEIDGLDLERLSQHPFLGQWFPFKVHHLRRMAGGATESIALGTTHTLKFTLLCDNGQLEVATVAAQDAAEAGTPALGLRLRDVHDPASMELCIHSLSCFNKGKAFQLHVAAVANAAAGNVRTTGKSTAKSKSKSNAHARTHDTKADEVRPVITTPFRVVKQRIRVTRTGSELGVFFKDEGGKDKYFELNVELLCGTNRVGNLRDDEIPITVTAHYNDEALTPAPKMTKAKTPIPLLVCADGTEFKIHRDGTGLVRCRINDVSKNHEKSGFRIRISAGQGIIGGSHDAVLVSQDPFSATTGTSHGDSSIHGIGLGGSSGGTGSLRRSVSNSGIFTDRFEDIASGISEPIVVRSKAKPSRAKTSSTNKTSWRSSPMRCGPGEHGASSSSSSSTSGAQSSFGRAALPRCDRATVRAIKEGRLVTAETSIKLLSEWGNSLTKSLESVGQYLADFTLFTHIVTRPLLHQLADQATNSAPIVQRIVSQNDEGDVGDAAGALSGAGASGSSKSDAAGAGLSATSVPRLELPRLSSLEYNFDNIPSPLASPGVGSVGSGASSCVSLGGLAPSSAMRQQSLGYSGLPMPGDLTGQWSTGVGGAFSSI